MARRLKSSAANFERTIHMIALILCLIVAAIHAYFLVLEMFRWEHPRTRKVFGMSAELAAQTKAMAANQGLYNGFLSAGIVFALWQGDAGWPEFTGQ